MRWLTTACGLGTLLFAACTGLTHGEAPWTRVLADTRPGAALRLTLDGERVVVAAAPIDTIALPAAARAAVAALPGRTTFLAREWDHGGDGFRRETLDDAGTAHGLLVAADGTLRERWRSAPLRDVPVDVLAATAGHEPMVDTAHAVDRPGEAPCWRLFARDRQGRAFVVSVSTSGERRGRWRRVDAAIDL